MNPASTSDELYDFVVIGSGFGGSVSALRLTEKGYRVLVLERGRRYRDQDFPRTNWQLWNYLWMPRLGLRGFLQMSLLPGVFVLHGSGVGGGSLVFAGVLMEPDEAFFNSPTWGHLADWKQVLRPHYATARRMLGVMPNPQLWGGDEALKRLADELGQGHSFAPTQVGIYFGEPGEAHEDPYFDGEGPARIGCIHCGGCMIGCRHNAKNSLPKNYLYLAERRGAEIRAESFAEDIVPLPPGQADGARYLVRFKPTFGLLQGGHPPIRAVNVIVSAGVLGTVRLLLRCRDELGTLAALSPRLGEMVRTNSESLVGAWSRDSDTDQSQGVAISSIIRADDATHIEVYRFPDGSSFLYWLLATPFVRAGSGLLHRAWNFVQAILRHPAEFIQSKLGRGIARRTVGLLIMQTEESRMKLRLGRYLPNTFRPTLITERDTKHPIPVNTELGHRALRAFSDQLDGVPNVSIIESLLGIPITAHIMGGCAFGRDAAEGVIGLDFQVHDYPGLYVVDGSVMPANPGINPSLTITALAEYAMSQVLPKAELAT